MKKTLLSTLMLVLLGLPVLGLLGCAEESKTGRTETITTPGGTTTTTAETSVKSTGENPPPNFAGETGKTDQ